MKFAADCMLGTLAKWLRVLGHDVAYFRAIEDGDLADLAAREGRTLLTADRRLVRRRQVRDHVLVRSHILREQIEQVLRERGLSVSSGPLLGRCLRCNTLTETVSPEAVRDQVPIYVYRTQERFTRCPGCARVYWRATHVTRMLDQITAVPEEEAAAPARREAHPRRKGAAPDRVAAAAGRATTAAGRATTPVTPAGPGRRRVAPQGGPGATRRNVRRNTHRNARP